MLKKMLFEGEFKRTSLQNFQAYLDKVGVVSQTKKKIALEAASFKNIISTNEENEVKIVTEVQYGVDLGPTRTETK